LWGKRGENTPVRVKRVIGDEKIMLTVLFSRMGILVVDFLPEGQNFNSEYMTSTIIPKLVAKIKETSTTKISYKWFIHLDNSPVHNSKLTITSIENSGFTRLPHPPYSPDLAPSDFSLFGYLKNQLSLKNCRDSSELKGQVTDFLDNLPTNWFQMWTIKNGTSGTED